MPRLMPRGDSAVAGVTTAEYRALPITTVATAWSASSAERLRAPPADALRHALYAIIWERSAPTGRVRPRSLPIHFRGRKVSLPYEPLGYVHVPHGQATLQKLSGPNVGRVNAASISSGRFVAAEQQCCFAP